MTLRLGDVLNLLATLECEYTKQVGVELGECDVRFASQTIEAKALKLRCKAPPRSGGALIQAAAYSLLQQKHMLGYYQVWATALLSLAPLLRTSFCGKA